MRKLFEKYLANNFQDFKGSTISANVVVNEDCINELIAEMLRTSSEPSARLVKSAKLKTNGSVIVTVEVEA